MAFNMLSGRLALMEMVIIVLIHVTLPTSPPVEALELRGGSARRWRLHAELLLESTARARETRVCSLHSPPDQDQGTFACSKAFFSSVIVELHLRLVPCHLLSLLHEALRT